MVIESSDNMERNFMEKFYKCVDQTRVPGSHEKSISSSEKKLKNDAKGFLLKTQDLNVLEHSEILRVILKYTSIIS